MPFSAKTSSHGNRFREHPSCGVCGLGSKGLAPGMLPMLISAHQQASTSATDCLDCMPTAQCQDVECAVGITEECTEECVVVACDDPNHVASGTTVCEDCPDMQQVFACCNEPFPFDPATLKELDAILCQCGVGPPHHDTHHEDFTQLASDWPHAHLHHNSFQPHPPTTFDHFASPFPGHAIPPQPLEPTPSMSFAGHFQMPQATSYAPLPPMSHDTPSVPHRCMWNHCSRTFVDFSALVGHVNVDHLRHPEPQPSSGIPTPGSTPLLGLVSADMFNGEPAFHGPHRDISTTFDHTTSAVQQWQHTSAPYMNTEPSPSKIPTASSSASSSSLRLSPASEAPSSLLSDASPSSFTSHATQLPLPELSSGIHLCRWQGCALPFGSVADLDAHVDETHIGSGKAHYDCHWANCERHGTGGFASRQKVKRHVQSHTGHRPHTCSECGQSFSEAATLQQHQRRHNKEKPHKCDVPGCGKAFTVAGALTIHKRTHSGDKPFQCAYCDKKFAESSNLSKHMRTHTGARPYACPQCDKTFARPDQLNRHVGSVHKKTSSPSVGEGSSAAT